MSISSVPNSGAYSKVQDPKISSTSDQPNFYSTSSLEQTLLRVRSEYRRTVYVPSTHSIQVSGHLNPNALLPSPNPRLPLAPRPRSRRQEANDKPKRNVHEGSAKSALVSLGIIFGLSAVALGYVYMSFPKLDPGERQHIKIPFNIDDAKQLGIVLSKYKDRYFLQVLSGICLTYVFLQTFAIPGSIFLSILSGFLFPFLLALAVICFCSALGATLCYLLSQLVGRRLVFKYFPKQAEKWAVTVEKHKDHLLNYMLFLRMTPFLPNWFINLTAPVIGVHLLPFALGTFFGVAPPSFIAIQAGQTLHKMTSSSDAWSWWSITLLGIFSLVSLVPVLLKRRLKDKFE